MKKRYIVACLLLLFLWNTMAFAEEKRVEYEGSAKKLTAVPDDFFAGFGECMPGDQIQEEVKLYNRSERTVNFYFYTKLEQQLKQALEQEKKPEKEDPISRAAALLKQVKLTISIGQKEGTKRQLYSGNLAATALSEAIDLGAYSSKEEGSFTFSLEIPKELTNVYARSETEVIWVFGVKEEGTAASLTDPSEAPSPPPASMPAPVPEESGSREASESVILGIESHTWILGCICIMCGAAGIIYLFVIRKKP